MNKNIENIKSKLESEDWNIKLESEFYMKDIDLYIIESVELSVLEKLEILITEKKRVVAHEKKNEISNYNNLIVEIRIKQLNIHITQLQQMVTIDKMKSDLLESEALINKII